MRYLFLTIILLMAPLPEASADTITEFAIPTQSSAPAFVSSEQNGLIWFTESSGNKIGSINTSSGKITEYPLPHPSSKPWGVTVGPDGKIWFTERDGDRIGVMTTAGAVTEYPLAPNAEPYQIISDPSNQVLWFTEYSGNKIGKINTAGVITEFSVRTPASKPTGLVQVGTDLWFCEEGGNKLAKMDSSGNFFEFTLPSSGSLPNEIVLDTNNTLWFTMPGTGRIGESTLFGDVSEHPITTPSGAPLDIVQGPIGTALWFTESGASKIGKMGFNGVMIGESATPSASSAPFGIKTDSLGRIWFSEQSANKIARLVPSDLLAISTGSSLPAASVGTPFTQTLSSSGGTPPITFTNLEGNGFSLPQGFTLSPGGVLSGTPAAPGRFFIRVMATDAAAVSVLKGFLLTVPAAPLPDFKARISLQPAGRNSRTVRITVKNQGHGDAPAFLTKVVAGNQRRIGRRDTVLFSQTLPPLAAQSSMNETFSVKSSRLRGKRYLGVCVNCDRSVVEEVTGNDTAFIPIR